MKLRSTIAYAAAAIAAGAVATTQPISAQSRAPGIFYCGINNSDNSPATLVQHPNRGEVVFINWKSNYFGASGWTPGKRCTEVSQRFQKYQQQGSLNYVVSGSMNGYPVVCAANSPNEGCNGRLLFTLQKGTNPNIVIEQIYARNIDANSDPLDQEAGGLLVNSSGKIVLHVDSFLEVAPVNTSQCNNLFGSCH